MKGFAAYAKTVPGTASIAVLTASILGINLGAPSEAELARHAEHKEAPHAKSALYEKEEHAEAVAAPVAAPEPEAVVEEAVAPVATDPAGLGERLQKLGLPSQGNVRYFGDYVAGLNYERKTPSWVYQSLTRDKYQAEYTGADRKKSQFTGEVEGVPAHFQASNDDYRGSGYTRGHLAPASDSKTSTQDAMDETFLLGANVVPQEWNSNSNFWYRMEVFCRKPLTESFDVVDVVSGPLFLPSSDGVVSYRVIGENQVAVPTHLFKVVSASFPDGDTYRAAFVVPNGPLPSDARITSFQVPLASLEKNSGLQFFANDESPAKDLCGVWDCDRAFMTEKSLKEWNLSRRLSWAKSFEEVEKIWADAASEGISINDAAKDMYDRRVHEFRATSSE